MNILKNVELAFAVAAGLACSVAWISTQEPAGQAAAKAAFARMPAGMPAGMPVVVVSARRMTPEQKAQSLNEEQQQAALVTRGAARLDRL